jgi:hypothetical protein
VTPAERYIFLPPSLASTSRASEGGCGFAAQCPTTIKDLKGFFGFACCRLQFLVWKGKGKGKGRGGGGESTTASFDPLRCAGFFFSSASAQTKRGGRRTGAGGSFLRRHPTHPKKKKKKKEIAHALVSFFFRRRAKESLAPSPWKVGRGGRREPIQATAFNALARLDGGLTNDAFDCCASLPPSPPTTKIGK